MQTDNNIYGEELELIINATGDDALFYTDRNGEIVVTVYKVFPGVTLAYYNVHSENPFRQTVTCGFMEISHCREGRTECEYDDCFYYLTAGDLAIKSSENGFKKTSEFPIRHYHGISILIQTDSAPDCFSCFLSDVNVKLSDIIQKYCGHNGCYIQRSNHYVEHIFSELYSVPQSVRKGYLKVKVLELLLYLTGADLNDSQSVRPACSTAQIKLAKKMCAYLNDSMDKHITIAQLAKKFNISESGVKTIFKNAFGMSVYTYIKTQKMQTASFLLQNSDKSIMNIAIKCGYSNASKFSKAFQDVMGMLPKDYRQS